MLSVNWRAKRTASLACSCTCSGLIRSFFSMCSGEVAMKVWMRRFSQPASASAARLMSLSLARASEQTVESLTELAIERTASKSPLLEAAKPASITSTRSRSSCLAMRSFSSRVIEAPGLCSPSRSVVSKMIRRSMVALRTGVMPPASRGRQGKLELWGGGYLRAGRSSRHSGPRPAAARREAGTWRAWFANIGANAAPDNRRVSVRLAPAAPAAPDWPRRGTSARPSTRSRRRRSSRTA
jgi:hypothetical protein